MATLSKSARKSFGRVSKSVSLAWTPFLILHRSDIKLDSGFKDFYAWCRANDIPVIIVSRWVLHACRISPTYLTLSYPSGMAPIIRAVLSNLVGDEAAQEIDIIANDADVQPDGKWSIKFRHPSRCVIYLIVDIDDLAPWI